MLLATAPTFGTMLLDTREHCRRMERRVVAHDAGGAHQWCHAYVSDTQIAIGGDFGIQIFDVRKSFK